MSRATYSLEDLARDFRLTPRTARYYVETVLPEHHRSGRGRVAEYGQDTWNCFRFIEKARAQDLTLAQIAGVLTELGQDEIDRVAEGEEELTIVPVSSTIHRSRERDEPRMRAASERRRGYENAPDVERPARDESFSLAFAERPLAADEPPPAPRPSPAEAVGASRGDRWQVLYRDDDLQISHRGHADHDQFEQVRLAAELIKNILRRK